MIPPDSCRYPPSQFGKKFIRIMECHGRIYGKESAMHVFDTEGRSRPFRMVLTLLALTVFLLVARPASAAVLPLTLSIQGMGVGALSGEGTILNQSSSYSGGGWGAGLLATLNVTDSWGIRAQANFIRLTGTPAMDLVPVTLGIQYTFLNILDVVSLYALGDAGYNYGSSYGGSGNTFVWDAGLGATVGIFYAEVRYESFSGPLLTAPGTSLGSLSFVPVVVGFTFL
ncbi:hypothetical protein BOX24_06075 [Leptospirillum ferriphilum]|jgi:hypothetical protein|uniref:Outer membrane protein beta-barrel domain-containing protein n=2 Tax=Nitrospiraceae TaxID=189779 RepID=A0A1V3SX87_9BACT|nr:hypothetical protein ABH19_03220 [Leptospirillum sp. Group II 'CF-1']OOH72944.1 hypothetical protein BOX24_06075 [Leptospirillum ferriphilum]